MKSLKNHMQEKIEKNIKKIYHLSYDIINSKDEKEYNKYLEHLIKIIELSNPYLYDSVCESRYLQNRVHQDA